MGLITGFLIIVLVAALISPLVAQTTGQTTSPTAPTTLDSFHNFNSTELFGGNSGGGTANFAGEIFTVGGTVSFPVASAQFLMNQSVPWTGAIVAQIWNIQGNPGSNALPVGSQGRNGNWPAGLSLAVSAPFTGPLTSTMQTVTFSFSSSPILQAGSSYAVSFTSNSTIGPGAQAISPDGLTFPIQVAWLDTFNANNPAYPNHNAFTIVARLQRAFWFTVTGQFITGFNIANSIGTVPVLLLFPLVFAALGLVWMWKHGQVQGV